MPFLVNGQPSSTARVGDSIVLDVPGYSTVWMDQFQNGKVQYSGLYSVPSPPYTLQPRDAGLFQGSAYTVDSNGGKGSLIEVWQFTVNNSFATAPGTPPPPVSSIIPSLTPPVMGQPAGAPPITGPTVVEQPVGPIGIEQTATQPDSSVMVGTDNTWLYIGAAVVLFLLLRKKI